MVENYKKMKYLGGKIIKKVEGARERRSVVEEGGGGVINTRKRGYWPLAERKRQNVALFPYSWIGLFWKDFPFPNIIPFSFSDDSSFLSFLFPKLPLPLPLSLLYLFFTAPKSHPVMFIMVNPM